MAYFDTHAHLCDDQLRPELEHWLELARAADLKGIIAVATTLADSRQCVRLARRNPQIHASVGIHCNECQNASDEDWKEIERLAEDPSVVALGETGLDLHWDFCPLERQQVWFGRHFALSRELKKPVIIHMRDCEPEMVAALREQSRQGPLHGVMHSFSGSWDTARECIDFGLHISFAGMVTFRKSEDLQQVAARVPDERLLIETDSPYLTPHPFRGQRPNHPAMVVHTAARLAELRETNPAELAQLTTRNAQRLFGLPCNDEPQPS